MKTLKLSILLVLTFTATSLFAQSEASKYSFEFNVGPSLATQSLGNTDLNMGLGFEGTFTYRFMPHLGVYAGWGWNKFAADEQFVGIEADFEEAGDVVRVKIKHPVERSDISW